MMTPFLVQTQHLGASQQQQSNVEASLNSKTVKVKGMQATSRLQSLEKPKKSVPAAGNGGLGLVNNLNYYGGKGGTSNPPSTSNNFMRQTNPLIAGGVSSQQQQQQVHHNGQQTPSGAGNGMLSGAFFESPMMNTGSLTDFANQSRQMSPPMSTSFLSLSLPETPSGMKMAMDNAYPMNSSQASNNNNLEKAKKTTSNLLNISRPSAQQDKSKQQQQSQQRGQSQQHEGLFPPLEVRLSPPNPAALTNSNNNNNNNQMTTAMPPPGPMTNMLRSNRLSASGLPDDYADSGLADLSFVLSPMEMGRSLSGSGQMQMAESPMTQSLRLIHQYHAPPPSYASSMMAGNNSHPTWSLASIGQPPSTGFFAGNMGMDMSQQQQHGGYSGGYNNNHQLPLPMSRAQPTAVNKKRRASEDSEDDDSSVGQVNKRKKKPAKPVDPNEPKITSKHRGVCWYKRTKKWVVQTKINGKRVHVGYFDDEEKAAEAYKSAVQSIQIKKALEAKQRAAEDMSKNDSI